MKTKVKFVALVLVIGLLGLAILASPIFGKGKTTYLYDITVTVTTDKGKELNVTTFWAAGNKDRTRIVGEYEYQQGMPTVEMNFPDCLTPDVAFRTSTIPKVDVQDLNSEDWRYHSGRLDYRNGTLSFRFDLFIYYYPNGPGGPGAYDHYILGIEMESWTNDTLGDATLNWTHYTEPVKPRGKNLQVKFQQSKRITEGELTITITEKTD